MMIDKKYEQWKSITESDFVTLFIKTWFTYIATLRELNPDVLVFTEDGVPRGDKPFLNAYKSGIMSIVQKRMDLDNTMQELYKLYPFAMKKVIEVFPQYLFQTFYMLNREFKYIDNDMQKDKDGKLKDRYNVTLCIIDSWKIRVNIGLSGYFKTKSYNEKIKFDIDAHEIYNRTVQTIKSNSNIDEQSILKELYSILLERIYSKISNKNYTEKYNQTINSKIQSHLTRIFTSIRLNFEKNYRFPNEIDNIYDTNSFTVFQQMPYSMFYKSYEEGLINKEKVFYNKLIKNEGIEWFASFVYSLRNALFHEIISPLDEDWQRIFKSAYLILKRISDICIDIINNIFSLNKIDGNPIIEYITSEKIECLDNLADYVELLGVSQISLTKFKINNEEIITSGIIKIKVKLQNGEANDFQDGIGEIFSEEPISVNFEAALDDNLEILETKGGQKDIEFTIS